MILIPIVLAAAAAHAHPTAAVTGRALRPDGSPAAGVAIVARQALSPAEAMLLRDEGKEPDEIGRTTSASDGTFRLGLPAGRATIQLSATGLATGTFDVEVDSGETDEEGDVELSAGELVSGIVTDDRGHPVSGAHVTIQGTPDSASLRLETAGTTDAHGRFSVSDGTADVFAITAVAAEYSEGFSFRFGGRRRQTSHTSVQLEPGRRVSGRVLRPDGSPASDIVVTGSGHAARSATDGTFALDGVSRRGGPGLEAASDDWRGGVNLRSGDTALSGITIRISPAARLTGSVVDAVTRKPIARAALRAWRGGPVAFTNRKGTFAIRGLAPGSMIFTVSHPGYAALPAHPVELAPGPPARADLALLPMATLQGRVVDPEKKPVAKARVQAGPFGDTTGTDAGGRFSVFADPRSPTTIRVRADGFAPAAVTGLRLKPAEKRQNVVVTLERGLSASGRVVNDRKEPVAGAKVAYAQSRGTRRGRRGFARTGERAEPDDRFVVTDARGRFVLQHVEAGEYALTVTHEKYADKPVPLVRIEKDATPIGDIVLDPPAAIEGAVRDPSGDPVPSATVTARTGFGAVSEETESGPDGRFRLTRFAAGSKINVSAYAQGYGFATHAAEAPQTGLVLTLKKSGIVRGRVEDASNTSPVTAFSVGWQTPRARFGGGLIGMGGTEFESPDGTFEMTLLPGKWTLIARAAGYEPTTIGGIDIESGDVKEDLVFSMKAGAAIDGTVVDDQTGAPIPSAAVSWSPSGEARVTNFPGGVTWISDGAGSAETDVAGRFRLTGIPDNERVTLSAQEYSHSPATLDVPAGGASGLTIRLTSGSTIAGRVVESDGAAPPEATVHLQPLGGDEASSSDGAADASGEFLFEHLTPGTYQLTARSGAQSSTATQVPLAAGQNANGVVLTLAGGAAILGRITGLSAPELATVRVSASGASGFSSSTPAAADGSYQMEGAPPGEVKVTANVPGAPGRSLSQAAEITDDQTQVEVDLAFPAGSTLSGAVTRGGSPQASMMVNVSPQTPGATPTQGRGQTDENGRYSITGLADGDYVARVFALGGGGSSASFEQPVSISGDTSQDFDLPTLSVAGTVVEAGSSDPVAGARVTLDDGNATSAFAIPRATTDSSGAFEIDGISGGDLQMTIEKTGWQTLTQQLTVEASIAGASYAITRAEGITIHGLDGRSGTPLSLLRTVFFAPGGALAFSGSVSLDSTGKGEVPQLPPGTYAAYFFADGYAGQAFGGLSIPSPPLTLAMTPGGELDVRTDSAHVGAIAALSTAGGLAVLWNAARFDPSFALAGTLTQRPHLAPGEYVLTVQFSDGPKSYTLSVGEGQTTTISVP